MTTIRRLGAADLDAMRVLNAVFARAFEDPAHYLDTPPGDAWLAEQLAAPHVVALAAERDGAIVGGLVAYELPKLEQARRELDKFERARREYYIYDLAVDEAHRRRGVATALIGWLQDYAVTCGAWVIYVQADHGDDPAVALYTKLGVREDVMHFDIPPAELRTRHP